MYCIALATRLTEAPASLRLMYLPDEVLRMIFEHLNCRDLVRFSSTCRRLRHLIYDQPLVWKKMLLKLYPTTVAYLRRRDNLSLENGEERWLDIFKNRHVIQRSVHSELENFARHHFYLDHMSIADAETFQLEVLENKPDRDANFIIHGMLTLLHKSDKDKYLHLKYYAKQLIYYIRAGILHNFWADMKDEAWPNFLVGLVHFAQWLQAEEVDPEKVERFVEEVALTTLSHLRSKKPRHPIFNMKDIAFRSQHTFNKSHPMAKYLFPGTHPGQDTNWYSLREAEQLFDAFNATFFDRYKFKFAHFRNENALINKVLENKRAIPTVLSLLYASIAKRLGLYCKPFDKPHALGLIWEYSPPLSSTESDACFYIDCLTRGRRSNEDKHLLASNLVPNQRSIFDQMAQDLMRDPFLTLEDYKLASSGLAYTMVLLELQYPLQRYSPAIAVSLLREYLRRAINLREVNDLRNYLVAMQDARVFQIRSVRFSGNEGIRLARLRERAKKRKMFKACDKETFAVGMVMKHKVKGYHCVIFGWDAQCKGTMEWMRTTGVDLLQKQDRQPFYYVLVDNEWDNYIPSEHLTPAKPIRIKNHMIPKYFREFDEEIGYLPCNEMISHLYPDDYKALLEKKGRWRQISPNN